MKTIKLPYKTTKDLTYLLKQYSNIVRYSYNRFVDGNDEKDIRLLTKSLNNIGSLNSWLIQCAILDGKSLNKRLKGSKLIFGGKNNLIQRIKNKISKEEYSKKRMCPINIQGEYLQKGNRSFKLDIANNKIIFKLNKKEHIEFILPNLRKNIKKDLLKLEELNKINQGQKGYTYSIRFDLKNIYISFEEFKLENNKRYLNLNRYLGIDLNPDNIGISILDNNKILYTQEFSLKKIIDKYLSERNLSSNNFKSKYYQNKIKFETFEISKSISLLAKQFNCKSVFIEDLKFKSNIKSQIKISNRKNKNLWKRNLFISNLNKRLNELSINIFKVNPAYSSFIGNFQHDYVDSINASLEIARRGYNFFVLKNKDNFYPNLEVKHQWKEMVTSYENWKDLYLEISKNLKLKYRVSLDCVSHKFKVFKQNSSHKSMILNYSFYD